MIIQIIINGIVTTSWVGMFVLGILLYNKAFGFLNICSAALFTLSPYLFSYYLNSGLTILQSVIMTLLSISILSLYIDIFVYRKLITRNSSILLLLLASFSLFIIIQNTLSIIWGDNIIIIANDPKLLVVGDIHFSVFNIISISTFALLFCIYIFIMHKTKTGLLINAIKENQNYFAIIGLPEFKIKLIISFVSGILISSSGIMHGYESDIIPTMGFEAFLFALLVYILCESINDFLVLCTIFGISILNEVFIWFIGVQWSDSFLFILILLSLSLKYLIFRQSIN